jgi:hypothetical protein
VAIFTAMTGALGYQRIMGIHDRNNSDGVGTLRRFQNTVGAINRSLPFGIDERF